jgi:hypothetical protein
MKQEEFKIMTEGLIKWNQKKERFVLAPRLEVCEDCYKTVKAPRRVVCEPYRMGTPWEHFKHTCRSCKYILFAGDVSKRPKTGNNTETDTGNAK